jgi:hypothetical protein
MSFKQLWLILPSRRTLVTVAVSGGLGVALVMFASAHFAAPSKPLPNADHPQNAQFVTIGRAYLPRQESVRILQR